ncbi:uncharacterized protein LOC110006652 [Amborella trichopoda]|uniref:uncharacterized protein LOC110006652 n=1 Tax=Amborella trichopoda TaxID=13333 RepID=UPI0009BDBA58|nr:uncharacterized protein LOC110006652 [Amborella trichopoda]|eukprot:XP_020518513.1 uncharacterized protein LOC110006652 [Amborella trichopoda]
MRFIGCQKFLSFAALCNMRSARRTVVWSLSLLYSMNLTFDDNILDNSGGYANPLPNASTSDILARNHSPGPTASVWDTWRIVLDVGDDVAWNPSSYVFYAGWPTSALVKRLLGIATCRYRICVGPLYLEGQVMTFIWTW